jgi:hypothetical protein
MTRSGECRIFGYKKRSNPEVLSNSEVSRELVLVSVPALAEAFFSGVDNFLVDVFAEPKRAELTAKRLRS